MHVAPGSVDALTAGGGPSARPMAPLALDPTVLEGIRVRSPGRLRAKRALDVVLGTVLTVATLPLVLVLAAWSAGRYRAWPFFTQDRVGQHGEHFTFIKIRSLPPATGAYALKHTLDQDTLPWLARVMRTRHLDELPQLWLVAAGRMSLVGPRPKMPDDFEPVDAYYAYVRTRVPQGCTGLWQVSEHQGELPSDTPQYEYFYLGKGGVRMDLWILWRTGMQMLGLSRPVALDAVPDWTHGAGWIRDESGLDSLAA